MSDQPGSEQQATPPAEGGESVADLQARMAIMQSENEALKIRMALQHEFARRLGPDAGADAAKVLLPEIKVQNGQPFHSGLGAVGVPAIVKEYLDSPSAEHWLRRAPQGNVGTTNLSRDINRAKKDPAYLDRWEKEDPAGLEIAWNRMLAEERQALMNGTKR